MIRTSNVTNVRMGMQPVQFEALELESRHLYCLPLDEPTNTILALRCSQVKTRVGLRVGS